MQLQTVQRSASFTPSAASSGALASVSVRGGLLPGLLRAGAVDPALRGRARELDRIGALLASEPPPWDRERSLRVQVEREPTESTDPSENALRRPSRSSRPRRLRTGPPACRRRFPVYRCSRRPFPADPLLLRLTRPGDLVAALPLTSLRRLVGLRGREAAALPFAGGVSKSWRVPIPGVQDAVRAPPSRERSPR